MTISATFESFEELVNFARDILGAKKEAAVETEACSVNYPQSSNMASAVSAPGAPAAPVPVTAAPIVPVTPQSVPQPSQTAPVPTTAQTYTLDDLARAAMTLMDSGRQIDLQQLLSQFGVEALPALPQAQYGTFATALRGMGAQI